MFLHLRWRIIHLSFLYVSCALCGSYSRCAATDKRKQYCFYWRNIKWRISLNYIRLIFLEKSLEDLLMLFVIQWLWITQTEGEVGGRRNSEEIEVVTGEKYVNEYSYRPIMKWGSGLETLILWFYGYLWPLVWKKQNKRSTCLNSYLIFDISILVKYVSSDKLSNTSEDETFHNHHDEVLKLENVWTLHGQQRSVVAWINTYAVVV